MIIITPYKLSIRLGKSCSIVNDNFTLFTDGSSYTSNGIKYTRAAVVPHSDTLWYSALDPKMSVQGAELVALTRA